MHPIFHNTQFSPTVGRPFTYACNVTDFTHSQVGHRVDHQSPVLRRQESQLPRPSPLNPERGLACCRLDATAQRVMDTAEAVLRPPLPPPHLGHHHGGGMRQQGPHTVQNTCMALLALTPTRTQDIPLITPKKCGSPPRAILGIGSLPVVGSPC